MVAATTVFPTSVPVPVMKMPRIRRTGVGLGQAVPTVPGRGPRCRSARLPAAGGWFPQARWAAESPVRRGQSLLKQGSFQGLVPERELRVLGHHLRGPGWVEDHLRVDLVDPLELADELAHLLGDLRPDRAGGRGQGEGDESLAVLNLDVVDEPERDEVESELGIDDLLERLVNVLFGCRVGCHQAAIRFRSRSACSRSIPNKDTGVGSAAVFVAADCVGLPKCLLI